MNKTEQQIYLFTDGSVNPKSGIGFGAYLLTDKIDLSFDKLNNIIKIKKFEETSSTKLELEALLWALNDNDLQDFKVAIYTDCQNIIGLIDRRKNLESKNYITSKGSYIENYELYKDFYIKLDDLDFELIKVKGHKKTSTKNNIDEVFTLVDKATRKALREEME